MTDASTPASTSDDPHIKRIYAALAPHHNVITPLIARIQEQDQEIATLKAQSAAYQAALDQTSAYIEQQTAAASSADPAAPQQ